jgi:hypothetical protein
MADKYYSNEIYGYADDESFYSQSGNARKLRNELLKSDKYYFQFKRQQYPGRSKYTNIGVFGSGDTGSAIRDAVTGVRNHKHKVGSGYEDLYFSARIATGEMGQNAPTLFFASPDEYERHLFQKVPNEVKIEWHSRNLAARLKYEGEDWERKSGTVVIR